MKTRQILILIASIIIMAIILWQGNFISNFSESDFIISDTSSIKSFSIEGQNQVRLSREGEGWKVNDDLRANPVAVNNFLYCFTSLEVLGMQAEMNSLQDSARKISLNLGKEKVHLRFYFSGKASFLHHEGSKKIYRVGIKGNPSVKLNEVFSDNPTYWLSKYLLDYSPDQILEIKVKPSFPWKSGFILYTENDSIKIRSDEGTIIIPEHFNREKALMYYSYFRNSFYDEIVREDSIIQRINNEIPFFSFHIKTINAGEKDLKVYPVYSPDKQKDIFHAYVKTGTSDKIFKVNYSSIDLLLADFESFYK